MVGDATVSDTRLAVDAKPRNDDGLALAIVCVSVAPNVSVAVSVRLWPARNAPVMSEPKNDPADRGDAAGEAGEGHRGAERLVDSHGLAARAAAEQAARARCDVAVRAGRARARARHDVERQKGERVGRRRRRRAAKLAAL